MGKLRFKAGTSDEVSEREIRNREIAYEAACESITLLENDGVLPLSPCRAALYGSAAGMTVKGGTGSGEVNERHSIDIQEGLTLAGFTVTTDRWISDWKEEYRAGKAAYAKEHKTGISLGGSAEDMINIMADPYRLPAGRAITEADAAESGTDVCIYAIARQAGECDDRSIEEHDFTFMPGEAENLRFCVSHYEKVILIINAGGSMDLSVLDEVPGINAAIYFCQQGMEGGRALADILTGKVNPSGGLTDTWVLHYEDVPAGDTFGDLDGNPKETDYTEGIYVGYRYYDTANIPVRYPFGYGLSYTNFALSWVGAAAAGSTVRAEVSVTNTGAVPGKKFVQVYAACPQVTQEKEEKKLVGYAKTDLLAPGASQNLTVSFDLHTLTSYSESDAAYILDEGDYVLYFGSNAADVSAGCVLRLSRTILLEQCGHICLPDKEIKEISFPHREPDTVPVTELPVIKPDADTIRTVVYDYAIPEEEENAQAETWLKKMSVKEKLTLLAGSGIMAMAGGGNPTLSVPGAAAYTNQIESAGIPSVALCDGPAGIRLQRVSA